MWLYHILFIHLTDDRHLCCLQTTAIVNNAVNICAQDFVWTYIFTLGYIPRSGIAQSNGSMMFTFLKNHKLVPKMATLFYIPSSVV